MCNISIDSTNASISHALMLVAGLFEHLVMEINIFCKPIRLARKSFAKRAEY